MREFLMNIDGALALRYFSYTILYFLLSGFFGGSETAFLSVNRIILYARQSKGNLSAKLLIYLVERSSKFLTGIVILNNVTLILSTLFVTKMLIEAFHIPLLWTPILTTLIMTPCTLLFAEVLPKSLGHPFSDTLSYKLIYLWYIIYFIMYPISWIFRMITLLFSYFFGFYGKIEHGIVKGEFQGLLDISLKSGALNTGERKFINNILEFRDIQASEAMTPLAQLVCIEKHQTVQQALELMRLRKVSILPVYNSRIDNPIGRVRAKDLINAQANDPISMYLQEAFFVPETAYLEKVLVQMQRQNLPLAFVADEYGGIVGVLRVEDIVAEIVGEVIEEGEIEFKVENDGTISANGLCDLDDLFEVLKLDIYNIDSKTLGGFIMEKLSRMPQENDIIYQKPWYFTVLSLQGRSIKDVKIQKKYLNNKAK